jgi:DNA (cytosine-5)-methyltransferase 1
MKIVGLFAGIGGLELGFGSAGFTTELLCEVDPSAKAVLASHFADAPIHGDVRTLRSLPKVDAVVAGFPCQNLSLAGNNHGIFGSESGLISEVFRLISRRRAPVRWLILENVPFMLWQKKGHAIRHITDELDRLGFRWAYRVVDARAFGLPQRRRRVLLVASRTEDPREVLFADDVGEQETPDDGRVPCGFFWTEGRGGLGWAVNAVPTLKGGSALGIPSPPAIWFRQQRLVATPEIRDAERLQGFEADWTAVDVDGKPLRVGSRWKLVGNAVSVPVATWLGHRVANPHPFDESRNTGLWARSVWPNAAWGGDGRVHTVDISEWPSAEPSVGLKEFLQYPVKPLSAKASAGFLGRARAGTLNFAEGFLEGVERHLRRVAQNGDRPTSRAFAGSTSP